MKSKPINPFAELDKIFKLSVEPQGEEWFTPKEYAKHTGIEYATVTGMLRKQCKAKVLECWTGFSKTNHRRIVKYRFVKCK